MEITKSGWYKSRGNDIVYFDVNTNKNWGINYPNEWSNSFLINYKYWQPLTLKEASEHIKQWVIKQPWFKEGEKFFNNSRNLKNTFNTNITAGVSGDIYSNGAILYSSDKDAWFYELYRQPSFSKNNIVFEENTAYHAETEEEAKILFEEFKRQGKKWGNSRKMTNTAFKRYTSQTCYNVESDNIIMFCELDWYYENNYKIVKVKDLFNLNNNSNLNNNVNYGNTEENNDTERLSDTRQSGKRAGRACISVRRRQITAGSRPDGNTQRAFIQKKTVKKGILSHSSVTSQHNRT